MPTPVIMPQMGESIVEGTITKWLKQIGDSVEKDEPLFEISTDKVDAEIPAPSSGILTEIKFPEGATVGINTVVAVLSENGSVPVQATSSRSIPERGLQPQAQSDQPRMLTANPESMAPRVAAEPQLAPPQVVL